MAIYESLLARSSNDTSLQLAVATTLSNFAPLLRGDDRWDEAEQAYRRAIDLQRQAVASAPDRSDYLAELGIALRGLGEMLRSRKRSEEAAELCREALAVCQQVVAQAPQAASAHFRLGESYLSLGAALGDTGRWGEAEEACRSALPILEKVVAEFPSRPDYREFLRQTHWELGHLCQRGGRAPEANDHYRRALAMSRQFRDEFPKVSRYQREYGFDARWVAQVLREWGQEADADELLRSLAERPDVLVADFESEDYGNWKVVGNAFGTGPARGSFPNQQPVTGFKGRKLVNSFLGGDRATGSLTSPPFEIERPYINLLIGGGEHPGETCVNLLVNGRPVRTATGANSDRTLGEPLAWVAWDVQELVGREAVIQIVDSRRGAWGHVNVDHIVQSDKHVQALRP